MHASACGAKIERRQMKTIFSHGKDRILLDIAVSEEPKGNVEHELGMPQTQMEKAVAKFCHDVQVSRS